MATDRERAQAWTLRDEAESIVGAIVGRVTHKGLHGQDWSEAVEIVERALAPTDEEREAMREVVEKARRAEIVMQRAVHRVYESGHIGVANSMDDARNELHDALARFDAATGGRGDG